MSKSGAAIAENDRANVIKKNSKKENDFFSFMFLLIQNIT